jgi:hypothetical protein
MDLDKLITLYEAAERLPGNIKSRRIRKWIVHGRLPGYRVSPR